MTRRQIRAVRRAAEDMKRTGWPRPPAHHPDKGQKDGRCNRTACQEPGAHFFNQSTRRYYCLYCARSIQAWCVISGSEPVFDDLPNDAREAAAAIGSTDEKDQQR